MISNAHEGLKAAITKVLSATWQRCRVPSPGNARRPCGGGSVVLRPIIRNALAHAGKTQRRIVSAWIGTAFAQDDAAAAAKQWRKVADQVRPHAPGLATLMDDVEVDVLVWIGME